MFLFNLTVFAACVFYLCSKNSKNKRSKDSLEENELENMEFIDLSSENDKNHETRYHYSTPWIRGDKDFVLRDVPENKHIHKLLDIDDSVTYLKFQPNYLTVGEYNIPLGKRRFKRNVLKICKKNNCFEMWDEIKRISWWVNKYPFPAWTMYPFLKLSHINSIRKCSIKNERVCRFFKTALDDDIDNIHNPVEWFRMWNFYFKGGTCTFVVEK